MQLSENQSSTISYTDAQSEVSSRLGRIVRALRPVTNFLDRYEGTVLKYAQGHVRVLGYAQNAVFGAAAASHLIDGYTALGLAMTLNLLGMSCTWGTLAYYGINNDSKLRQFFRFVKSNIRNVWEDPDHGVDKVKESVAHKLEEVDGKWGDRLRSGLRYYGVVRRLPALGSTIHTVRVLMQKDVKFMKDVYDSITLDMPTEYFVSLPVNEYGVQPDWIYSFPRDRDRPVYRKIVIE